jgi:ribosomal protein S18 acetylase RimI-like enzyme
MRYKATDIQIQTPTTHEEMLGLRSLFMEYANSLQVDLCFQNFNNELLNLPGDYRAPLGALLMATANSEFAGCCALRPLRSVDYPNACEMKRLYVRPDYRGLGLGRRLTEKIMDAARLVGYGCILLDTLDDMESARTLYDDLGFVDVPPYYFNPIAGAHYLKATL